MDCRNIFDDSFGRVSGISGHKATNEISKLEKILDENSKHQHFFMKCRERADTLIV